MSEPVGLGGGGNSWLLNVRACAYISALLFICISTMTWTYVCERERRAARQGNLKRVTAFRTVLVIFFLSDLWLHCCNCPNADVGANL